MQCIFYPLFIITEKNTATALKSMLQEKTDPITVGDQLGHILPTSNFQRRQFHQIARTSDFTPFSECPNILLADADKISFKLKSAET